MKRLIMMALLVAFVGGVVNTVSAKTKIADINWKYERGAEEYDTMTLEIYAQELAAAQQQEKQLQADIVAEQVIIDSLNARLIELDQLIAQVSQEIYDILGITEEDVLAAEAEIAEIRQNLEMLLSLSPEELQARNAEIGKNEARINALKEKPVSYLWRVRDQIVELEDLLARVKANLPDEILSYTVELKYGNRDCLYRIAGYDEVYGDATRWPELYRANKGQIDQGFARYKRNVEEAKYDRAQDIIFPGQVFDIPR